METRTKRAVCLIVVATFCGCPGEGNYGAGADGLQPDTGLTESEGANAKTSPKAEQCDQLDNDGDGRVDEGCGCEQGQTQPCFPGDVSALVRAGDLSAGLHGLCAAGTQTCNENADEFRTWGTCAGYTLPAEEICDDGIDQDCDGSDLPCETNPDETKIEFSFEGDCRIAECPDDHPHVVGCDVTYDGGDGRACVAQQPDDSKVYFQEGNDCCYGSVSGTITCSAVPGPPLDQTNCRIKTTKATGFTEVTYTTGCGGCVKAHCAGEPYTCEYHPAEG